MPSARIIRKEVLRNIWFSRSVIVWAGAITMESPVWIPTGSTFSMLQTTIALSLASRITSYSISLKPAILCSIKHWDTGDIFNPASVM